MNTTKKNIMLYVKAITVVVYVTVLIVEIIMFGTAVKFIKNVREKIKAFSYFYSVFK